MNNYVQGGKVVTWAVPEGGCVSGRPYELGEALIGVATVTATSGMAEFAIEGVFELAGTAAGVDGGPMTVIAEDEGPPTIGEIPEEAGTYPACVQLRATDGGVVVKLTPGVWVTVPEDEGSPP